MEYSERKRKFIELTSKYIKEVEPLLEMNKKVSIGNIRFTMYQIMIVQQWHKDAVALDEQGKLTYPKKKTNGKVKQYGA